MVFVIQGLGFEQFAHSFDGSQKLALFLFLLTYTNLAQ